jgi:hypothetical protein
MRITRARSRVSGQRGPMTNGWEYKAEQVERATHLRLRAVDVEVPVRRDDALPLQPEEQP